MQGIEYLRKKLDKYRRGALKRQITYDMKNRDIEPSIAIPATVKTSIPSNSRLVL